jgi:hypothetical protein
MEKLFTFKRMFATALSLFAIIATASADWNVYDCSQTPLDFGMSAGSSNTSDYNEIAEIIADPDNSDNSLLNFLTVDNESAKYYFTQSLSDDYSTDNGFTVVARVKALTDTAKVVEFELRAGFYREKIRIDNDGDFNVEKGTGDDTKIDYTAPEGTDMLDWNIYRFTFKDSTLNIWVNDVQIASDILSTNASSTSTEFTIGDSNGSSIYAAEFDWIIWDETGVYAPGEGTDYPSEIILDPLADDEDVDDDEEGDSNWSIYSADETFLDYGFSAGSSSDFGGDVNVIADEENSGNNLVELIGSSSLKNYWKYKLTDSAAIADQGVTILSRMKSENDSSYVAAIQVTTGEFYAKVYVKSDGDLKIDGDATYATELDFSEYHIFRVTMVGSILNVWVDDVKYCNDYTVTSTSDNSPSFRIGDASTSDSYSSVIDWIIWDETAAYAPGEGADYPSEIILDPLEDADDEVEGSWDLYDASETPEAAGFSAGSSNSVGTSTILEDADNAGNKILDMRSSESDKWYWSSNHLTDVDPDAGFTVVYRMSGITADSASVGEMEVCVGGFRDKIRVYGTGQLNIEKAEITVDFPDDVDVMDFNIYRVTFQRHVDGEDTTGYTRVWINDEFVAEGYSTTTSSSNKYTIGDSNSGKSYAALIDWIIRDETGAYAPYENSDYPNTIVLDPLEGGEVEIPNILTFDDVSLAVAQTGQTITADLEANAAWLLGSTDTWLNITPVAGDSGVATITITAEANTGAAPRTGTIYGLIGEEFLDELTITQDGLAVQIGALSALASSEQLKDGAYLDASLAIDGYDSTAWVYEASIVNGESEWIKVAIPSGSEVVMVKIMEYKNNERLTSFSVDYWNGTEYVEVLGQQLSPLQSVANSEVAYSFPSTVTTDTIRFNFYGNTGTSETDPTVASGWLTISELSIWGAEDSGNGISEAKINFNVYPNPSTGNFVIDNAKGSDVKLISLTGKIMYEKSNISEKEQVELKLPIGLYILKVDQTVTKIVIE